LRLLVDLQEVPDGICRTCRSLTVEARTALHDATTLRLSNAVRHSNLTRTSATAD